jgi:hypothetical protein
VFIIREMRHGRRETLICYRCSLVVSWPWQISPVANAGPTMTTLGANEEQNEVKNVAAVRPVDRQGD